MTYSRFLGGGAWKMLAETRMSQLKMLRAVAVSFITKI
jgi:hypothetical protein